MSITKKKTPLYLVALFLLLTACTKPTPSSSISSSQSSTSETSEIVDYQIEAVTNTGDTYYEIFVRAFADDEATDNGVGDFKGVTAKADYLATLGISGVWLMPIMDSSSYHGYNTNNYYEVEPDYGTMTDFENMVTALKDKGIDTIIDLVLNHSGDQVEYFKKSAAVATGKNTNPSDAHYKDWYYWHEGPVSVAEGLKGTYRQYPGSNWYYMANFADTMPDLNLDNTEVRAEIAKIAKFWIDKGVHGFRLDAVSWLYENDHSKNVEFLGWFNDTVKANLPDAYIVGEAWFDNSIAKLPDYYASGIDSFFFFPGSQDMGYYATNLMNNNGQMMANDLVTYEANVKAVKPTARNSSFLSNHDQNRSAHYAAYYDMNKRKVGASMYLLSPGIPFIYYGEEIGLKGSGRDENKRLPMVWQERTTNWEAEPVEGANFDMSRQVTIGAYDQLDDPFSQLNHYRKLISLRNKYAGITDATIEKVATITAVPLMALAFKAPTLPGGEIIIVHNLSDSLQTITGNYQILDAVNTSQTAPVVEGEVIKLAPFSSVILQKGN